MKKIFVAIVVSFSLISCSISEQIIFNQDGSGKMSYTVDMSKMLQLTKDLDKSSKMTKDLTDGAEKDMDTVFNVKDILAQRQKDGKVLTAEQLANMEQMKDYSMRMVVNKTKMEMKYMLTTNFKNISEVRNIGSALTAMKDLSGKKTGGLDNATPAGNSEVKFELGEKGFNRTVIEKPFVEEIKYDEEAIDTTLANSDFQIEKDTVSYNNSEVVEEVAYDDAKEEKEMTKEEIKKMNKEFEKLGEMMKKGLEDSAFEFQYTFVKKIKKVSLPKSSYKLSNDKKTIFIKYKFDEFTQKVKDLNLNIEFE